VHGAGGPARRLLQAGNTQEGSPALGASAQLERCRLTYNGSASQEWNAALAKTTRIDSIAVTGRSGERYEFRIYVWDTRLKAVPGVYLVASRTMEPGETPRYELLFAGEAADLSHVLVDHPRNECFQMYLANVIGALKEDDDGRRGAIVADLLAGLSPPCNTPDAE